MSVTVASTKLAQTASRTAPKAVRHGRSSTPVRPSKNPDLGRQIFVYSHLQTNQVVYSLTKSVKNSHALRQLPYNGKKTVPSALRKDLWAPFACITFTNASPPLPPITLNASSSPSTIPNPGLRTFQKLREYRKLHETQWPDSLRRDPASGAVLSRKERGRRLCNQRANSVADMAAALQAVTIGAPEGMGLVASETERAATRTKAGRDEAKIRAIIMWSDIRDAEFAESWPETVVHDWWETTRNNRRTPEEREAEVVETMKRGEKVVL